MEHRARLPHYMWSTESSRCRRREKNGKQKTTEHPAPAVEGETKEKQEIIRRPDDSQEDESFVSDQEVKCPSNLTSLPLLTKYENEEDDLTLEADPEDCEGASAKEAKTNTTSMDFVSSDWSQEEVEVGKENVIPSPTPLGMRSTYKGWFREPAVIPSDASTPAANSQVLYTPDGSSDDGTLSQFFTPQGKYVAPNETPVSTLCSTLRRLNIQD